jgi:hypothetical protein
MEETLYADGYEDCIIGHFTRCGKPTVIVYDADKCIQKLIDRDGMSYEEAVEFFEFNVVGAWVGEGTPAFMYQFSDQGYDTGEGATNV